MRNVKIITDSCADLNPALMEANDIDYARMTTILDGKSSPALLTWSPEEVHAFFDTIRAGNRITTAQVPTEEFHRVFEKYLAEGYDIVYIACSSKQSGSVNTGAVVAQQLAETYPDGKIYCIDSLNASYGEGILALEAARYAKTGKSAAEVAEYITGIRNNVLQYITVHTLEYLKRAGRVSAPSAFFGNLMGVKPILISDANGVQAPIKKVKGRQASLREMAALLKENIIEPEKQTVYVIHADCAPEEVQTFVDMIRSEVPCRDVQVWYIGPIIGASIGPDAIGVLAFGKTVTYEMKA